MSCKRPSVAGPFAPAGSGPIKDLASIRAGDQLTLTWTMPRRNAAKLAVNGLITVHVCWRESLAGPCTDFGKTLRLASGATGLFSEELPPALAAGSPRVIDYFVELMDRNGRSTGFSNRLASLAGAPPPAVEGLTAEMTPAGILLHWMPEPEASSTFVQVHRVREVLRHSTDDSANTPESAPEERDLQADEGMAQLLDKDSEPGETYAYSARRIARFTIGKQTLELSSQPSNSIEIHTIPAVPHP